MKDFITNFILRFSIRFFGMLVSIVSIIIFTGCTVDDIPPTSAYVAPPPPENCILLPAAPEIGSVVTDFECETPTFSPFGNFNGSTYTIAVVDNPVPGGINTSSRVVEVEQSAGVEGWAGFTFELAGKVDFSVNRTIKIKVYSPAAGQVVNFKLEDKASSGSIAKEVSAVTTVADQWEELSFIFSPTDDNKYDLGVLFFNFLGAKDSPTTHYFDDIVVVEGDAAPVLSPSVAAEDPFLPQADVIAIYSDVYTPITVTEFPTSWSGSGFEEIQIDGNNIIKYENLDFTGIVTDYGNPTDLSGKSYVHFDYWTANASDLGIKMVNTALDPAQEDLESFGTIVQEEWVSVDIPLADFAMDRSGVTQILFDNLEPGSGVTVFIDNLYFHDGIPTEPATAAPTPSVDAANVIAIYSDAYTPITVTELPTSWSGAGFEEVQVDGNNTIKYTDLDFTGIVTDYGNATDLSTMTHLHVDYWTVNAKELGIKLVNTALDPAQEDLESFGTITKGVWVSVDIPLADFAMDRSGVTQILIDNLVAGDASATVFIDNLYFYK